MFIKYIGLPPKTGWVGPRGLVANGGGLGVDLHRHPELALAGTLFWIRHCNFPADLSKMAAISHPRD